MWERVNTFYPILNGIFAHPMYNLMMMAFYLPVQPTKSTQCHTHTHPHQYPNAAAVFANFTQFTCARPCPHTTPETRAVRWKIQKIKLNIIILPHRRRFVCRSGAHWKRSGKRHCGRRCRRRRRRRRRNGNDMKTVYGILFCMHIIGDTDVFIYFTTVCLLCMGQPTAPQHTQIHFARRARIFPIK